MKDRAELRFERYGRVRRISDAKHDGISRAALSALCCVGQSENRFASAKDSTGRTTVCAFSRNLPVEIQFARQEIRRTRQVWICQENKEDFSVEVRGHFGVVVAEEAFVWISGKSVRTFPDSETYQIQDRPELPVLARASRVAGAENAGQLFRDAFPGVHS